MSTSEIITVVALILSSLVSITSIYITYLNNKANIRANRSEILFEKRLNALASVVEKIEKIRSFDSEIEKVLEKDDAEEKKRYRDEVLMPSITELASELDKQTIFLPPRPDKLASQFFSEALLFANLHFRQKDIDRWKKVSSEIHSEIIYSTREFLGYDDKQVKDTGVEYEFIMTPKEIERASR